jgi:hypoxanthine phosphoribosyltransferase
MPELVPVLSKNDIDSLVKQVAHRISTDYRNKDLILIGILKGVFVFLSDLVRCLDIPVQIDFVRIFSYGSDVSSCGKIHFTKDIEVNIKDKDVLIVDDIVDTGLTLKYLIDYLRSYHPKTIKVCVFIDKHERREADISIDYSCHVAAKGFLVGYGLDYNEDYRYLSEIYHLKL